jgi:predicted GH43/DUF377 family glycosyl hydrolase
VAADFPSSQVTEPRAAEEDSFQVERLGVVMEALPGDPREAWGVLNPAAARGRDGELYLFPRVVAERNYSRIGIARVLFDNRGVPTGVHRLGFALEPEEAYERNGWSGGGVEDARITFVQPLDRYVMTYTAFGPFGPRIGLAVSDDLFHWERLGPVKLAYHPAYRTDFDLYLNKDAMLFPVALPDPSGRPAIVLIHRPSYEFWGADRAGDTMTPPAGIGDLRPAMWLSYSPIAAIQQNRGALTFFGNHQVLAVPNQPWEEVKIGGGTPPVLTDLGWLVVYHGVARGSTEPEGHSSVRYCAGVMVLDLENPSRILYRSRQPVLSPETAGERHGIVPDVVFPTAVDVRDARHIDVYYGMADSRIGVVRLTIPEILPRLNRVDTGSATR